MPYRSPAIANEFLKRAPDMGLTQMQLQKLTFFAHGWHLGLTGTPLTSDDPEAWVYGPVFRDLYDHAKYFGNDPIGRLLTPDDDEVRQFVLQRKPTRPPFVADLKRGESDILDAVWREYGHLDAYALSRRTHEPGTPWFDAYNRGRNSVIDAGSLQAYFRRRADAQRAKLEPRLEHAG